MSISRREYIKTCFAFLTMLPAKHLFAGEKKQSISSGEGNFHYIYSNPKLRERFLSFYKNVFHLYPEKEFHQLIETLTKRYRQDEQVYRALQTSLEDIKPFLASLRYTLPALAKQKKIMTNQTLQLLDKKRQYEGYLEIGTTGRYLSQLEDKLKINNERYLLHNTEPGYNPEDIMERGQISKIGKFVDMGDYSNEFAKVIHPGSLDLVTVYIGFHHCPLEKREAFISSVRDVMKPGGKLILRDHDASNEDMLHIAALAHDTFNAGTHQQWKINHQEVRNFYSLKFIIDYLGKQGLRYDGKVLFQEGDPTRNGLMAFTRV